MSDGDSKPVVEGTDHSVNRAVTTDDSDGERVQATWALAATFDYRTETHSHD